MTTPQLPLGLHPDVIKIAQDDSDDDVLAELRAALKIGRESAQAAMSAVTAIRANKMQTAVANAKQARETAHRHYDASARVMDAARSKASTALAAIDKQTRAPAAATTPAEIIQHSEVRQALARLSTDQRNAAIAAALAGDSDDDRTIMAAVLNGASLLTGLSATELSMRRETWRRRHFPREIARAEKIRLALGHLDRGGSLLMSFVLSDLAGDDDGAIAAAEASERAARDAVAAAPKAVAA